MTHSTSELLHQTHQFTPLDESLHTPPDMDEFWKLETIGIDPPEKTNDNSVMQHFKDTITKENNRYHIAWPWKDETVKLPENYELSIGRLKSLYGKLSKDPDLLRKYDDIIKDQLQKNIIEKVDVDTKEGERKHYIPHHAVLKPERNTTKVRIVYDASAKTKKSNLCLNDCLHKGPIILEDLCGLLMRFRTRRFGIIADIEKAFLQVAIQPEERDVTRFFWLKDINKPPTQDNIIIYRFARIPFGIISSPFLLGATIQHHLQKEKESDGADISEEDMYVENLVTGADSEDEALQIYEKGKMKFAKMSMNLREWKTNSRILNKNIPKDD